MEKNLEELRMKIELKNKMTDQRIQIHLENKEKKLEEVKKRNQAKQKHSSSPSGSNFNLIKPEIGVVIEDKSNRKKEIKDGGFEYIKKYNKPSMYEFSKLVVETSNLNSLNSRALSSGLIESKVSEINEYKNRNKFQELNQDNYNGYIFEFSDNLNPLFQNALSLNDNQKKEEDKKNLNINNNNDIKEEKEEDI